MQSSCVKTNKTSRQKTSLEVEAKMPEDLQQDYGGPKSPRRTQIEQFGGHHCHWDPGGVKAFREPTSSDEHVKENHVVPLTDVEERIVHVPDEGQPIESKGAVGPNKKPEGIREGLSNNQTEHVQPDESTPSASDENTFLNKGQESIGAPVSASVEHMLFSFGIEADNASPLDEVVMMPSMSLPIRGDSYVLGLRPIACSETYYQLNRAGYVTGMLPFRKLPFALSLPKDNN